MKKLYVGCRVRILFSNGWPELAGQEGRIVGKTAERAASGGFCEWDVAPDSWGTPLAPKRSRSGGNFFSPGSDQIEPITPEGHQVISWEEMAELWTPERIEA